MDHKCNLLIYNGQIFKNRQSIQFVIITNENDNRFYGVN